MEKLAQMHCRQVNKDSSPLGEAEVSHLVAQLPGWRVYNQDGEARLEKSFQWKDFNQAIAFTNLVARVANQEDHHPAILTEWGKVTVSWWTHRIKGLHQNDFIMAAKTDQIYAQEVKGDFGP